MAKDIGPRRIPGIMTGFDMAALERFVEDADSKRPPTQEELAASYGANGEIRAFAHAYPASIDEIVAGICAQDERFLDQGRKLLKQHLRGTAKAEPDTTRKPRGRAARRAGVVPAPAQPTGDAAPPAPAGEAPAQQRPGASGDAPLFEGTDYSDADLYGG